MTGPRPEAVAAARERLEAARAEGLDLDMTRGKPSSEQLDLARPMLDLVTADDFTSPSGVDCRNYGGLLGLDEARQLLAPLLDVEADEVFVLGNSSLQLMYDTLTQAVLRGVPGGDGPWRGAKILAPSPGFPRMFSLGTRVSFRNTSPVGDEYSTAARRSSGCASHTSCFDSRPDR